MDVIDNINLNIKSGEIVALVGPSGAGKSTIFSLILKFMKPRDGLISIDNYDLNEIPTNIIRKEIALVPQQSFVFSGPLPST